MLGMNSPDLQALRRKAKAKESAALDPTRAKPSTPLLTCRALKTKAHVNTKLKCYLLV